MLPRRIDNDDDFLHLNPIQKLIKYRLPPWKLLLDAATVVLMLVFVALLSERHKPYLANMGGAFAGRFMPDGNDSDNDSGMRRITAHLRTAEEAMEHMEFVEGRYATLPAESADVFLFPKNSSSSGTDSDESQIRYWYTMLQNSPRSHLVGRHVHAEDDHLYVSNTTHRISPMVFTGGTFTRSFAEGGASSLVEELSKYGPDIKDTMERLVEAVIELQMVNLDINSISTDMAQQTRPECHLWTVTLHYDFSVRAGSLPVTIRWGYRRCQNFSKYCTLRSL